MQYTTSCHCSAIQATLEAPSQLTVLDCNCSMCTMTGHWHLILPASAFKLRKGSAELSEYNFGTGVGRHFFCSICGVRPFYIPRSNPDGIDVNARCLTPRPESLEVQPFDGQNWEKNAGSIAHLSE